MATFLALLAGTAFLVLGALLLLLVLPERRRPRDVLSVLRTPVEAVA